MWSFSANVSSGCVVNKATATGLDALGKKVCDTDKVSVTVKPTVCPRSKGYWKNHPEAWTVDEVEVGNVMYSKREAIKILEGANSKDATNMLTAQFIAAKLNRICGTSAVFRYGDKEMNVDTAISRANFFLSQYPFGTNPQGDARQEALSLKDLLDAYNNQDQ
jgi:hypothetical protein